MNNNNKRKSNRKMHVAILTNIYDSLLVHETMSIILLKNGEKKKITSKSMILALSFSEDNFFI